MQFFSLGIPAHNEGASIGRMISRVVKSTAWKDHEGRREIIVCANACSDNTAEVVRELQQSFPEIKLIESPIKSKNRAWEMIVKQSNPLAKNLFFADADVLVSRDAFDRLDTALGMNKSKVIAGARIIPSWNYSSEKGMYEKDYAQFMRALHSSGMQGLQGALYAIRRAIARKIQMPAHAQIGDDYFLQAKYGKQIIIVPEAKAVYRPPARHELFSARVRSTVSKQLMRSDPAMKGLVKSNGRSWNYWKKAIPFAWKLGMLRAARIYWRHVRKPKAIHQQATDHVAAKTDAWSQIPSTKLVSRRRPLKG